MPRLSTGFVRANGYANKVRKVLFALTRGKVVPEKCCESEIEWNYDSLQTEVYKKDEEEKLAEAMEEIEESERTLEAIISQLPLPDGRGL